MGRPEPPGQPPNTTKLAITDQLLWAISEEIRQQLGFRTVFESGLYDGDQIESPGHVEVYSHSERNGFVRRTNIYCSTTQFTVREACGTHQMASKTTFELADPTSIERLLAHVKKVVEHWIELERIFNNESETDR